MARELQRKSRKRRLEMNIDKTKYMRNVEGEEEGVFLENGRIEEIDQYVYLGQTVSLKSGLDNEMGTRRRKTWRQFWGLQRIFNSKLALRTKMKILESCVIESELFGYIPMLVQ